MVTPESEAAAILREHGAYLADLCAESQPKSREPQAALDELSLSLRVWKLLTEWRERHCGAVPVAVSDVQVCECVEPAPTMPDNAAPTEPPPADRLRASAYIRELAERHSGLDYDLTGMRRLRAEVDAIIKWLDEERA